MLCSILTPPHVHKSNRSSMTTAYANMLSSGDSAHFFRFFIGQKTSNFSWGLPPWSIWRSLLLNSNWPPEMYKCLQSVAIAFFESAPSLLLAIQVNSPTLSIKSFFLESAVLGRRPQSLCVCRQKQQCGKWNFMKCASLFLFFLGKRKTLCPECLCSTCKHQ